MSKVAQEKAELRIRLKLSLLKLKGVVPQTILDRSKGVIGLFQSLPGEPDTTAIAQSAQLVLYPDIDPEVYAKRLLEHDASLLLVPGFAFTESGERLGRGGGYYDRCIRLLRSAPICPQIIGVCFKEQIFAELPTEAHDQKVDVVIGC